MKAALIIDMPKNCLSCRVFNGRCIPLNADVDFYDGGRGSKERLPGCPLVAVPEENYIPTVTVCRKCGRVIHSEPHRITVRRNDNNDVYNICNSCFENLMNVIDNFMNEEGDY